MNSITASASRVLLPAIILLSAVITSAQTKPDALLQVKLALDAQVAAWNSGAIDKSTSVYYDSPQMLWVNRTGIRKGAELIRASYQRAPAQRPRVGTYSYDTLHIEQLSRDCVFFVIKWRFEQSGRTPMNGVTSMVWKRINKKWVIAAEHAS